MLARLYSAKHLRLDLRWATQHRAKIHFLFRTTLAKSCRLSKLIPLRIHFETLGYDSLECIWRGLGLLQNDPLKNIRYRVFSNKKPFKRIRASKTQFLSKIDQNASKESRTNSNLPHAKPQQVLPRKSLKKKNWFHQKQSKTFKESQAQSRQPTILPTRATLNTKTLKIKRPQVVQHMNLSL